MLEPYPFLLSNANCSTEGCSRDLLRVRLYTFVSESRDLSRPGTARYIVQLEHYRHDVFVIKYFPKKLAQAGQYKFQIISDAHDMHRIVVTVTAIAFTVLQELPTASFAFIGMPTVVKPKLAMHGSRKRGTRALWRVEESNPSQRYRIYAWYMKRIPQAADFDHRMWPDVNAYLLLNKQRSTPELENDITTMFRREFNDVLDPRVPMMETGSGGG